MDFLKASSGLLFRISSRLKNSYSFDEISELSVSGFDISGKQKCAEGSNRTWTASVCNRRRVVRGTSLEGRATCAAETCYQLGRARIALYADNAGS